MVRQARREVRPRTWGAEIQSAWRRVPARGGPIAGYPASGNFRCLGQSRPSIMTNHSRLRIAKNKSGRTAMTSLSPKATLLGAVTALTFACSAFAGPKVEVLHYWTSGGESKAVLQLKKEFQAAGGTWVDSPVAGGGDAQATVLRSRVVAGNPPSVVQMKGPNIKDWAGQGVLNDIDEVAKAENWDNLLPPLLKDVVT